MEDQELDAVDRGILYLLQQDARNATVAGIGEAIGIADSTVSVRLDELESEVIRGYVPVINYEAAGYGNHVAVAGSADPSERAAVADKLYGRKGVVNVTEMLTGRNNILVEAVSNTQVTVDEQLQWFSSAGLDIDSVNHVRRQRIKPFDRFGENSVD